MVTHKVDPVNGASARPGKGKMTWIGIAAIVVFILAVAFATLRPVVDRNDGPEPGRPAVLGPASAPAQP